MCHPGVCPIRLPEVPLSHGDNPPQTAAGKDTGSSGPPDEGLRQPDPRSVTPAADGSAADPAARLADGSVDDSAAGDSGGGPGGREAESAAPIASAAIREAVRLELQQWWQGPLPPPEILSQYEQLLPGMAERLLVIAEKSATGQIDTADKMATAEIEAAKLGQSLAFALTLFAFIAAVVFFALDNRWAGVAFTSVPVAMLIRSFLRRSG
jgi:uncharacterized membrane protein